MTNPKQLTFPWEKNFKASFDGFFCDDKNIDLIDNLKADKSDDMFIYGPSNIGKTYLLQAVTSFYSDLQKTPLYIPLSEVKKYDTSIIDGACEAGMTIVRTVDAFINGTEPFRIAKDESRKEELAAILYRCAECVRIASLLLAPVLTERMADLWTAMGIEHNPDDGGLSEAVGWGGLKPGTNVTKVALFPRVEFSAAE